MDETYGIFTNDPPATIVFRIWFKRPIVVKQQDVNDTMRAFWRRLKWNYKVGGWSGFWDEFSKTFNGYYED